MRQQLSRALWPTAVSALTTGVMFWVWASWPLPGDLNVGQWRGVWLSGVFAFAIAIGWRTTQLVWTAVGAWIGVFSGAVWTMYSFPSDTGHSLHGAVLDAIDFFWIDTTLTPIVFVLIGLTARLTKRVTRSA